MTKNLKRAVEHLLSALTGNELSELHGKLEEERRKERGMLGDELRARAAAAGSGIRLAAAHLDEEADLRAARM